MKLTERDARVGHHRLGCLLASVPSSATKVFTSQSKGLPGSVATPPGDQMVLRGTEGSMPSAPPGLSTRPLAAGPACPKNSKSQAYSGCVPSGHCSSHRARLQGERVAGGDGAPQASPHRAFHSHLQEGGPSASQPVGLPPGFRLLSVPWGSQSTAW